MLLVFIAERDNGRDKKAGDAKHRAPDPAGAEFLCGDDLLDRGGRAAPRFGQIRHHPAALNDRVRPLIGRNLLQGSDFGAQVIVGGAAERGGEPECPAVVDARVVFPGEADAAVYLYAILGAALGGGRS